MLWIPKNWFYSCKGSAAHITVGCKNKGHQSAELLSQLLSSPPSLPPPFSILPKDVLIHTISELPLSTLANLSRVNKSFYCLINDQNIWKLVWLKNWASAGLTTTCVFSNWKEQVFQCEVNLWANKDSVLKFLFEHKLLPNSPRRVAAFCHLKRAVMPHVELTEIKNLEILQEYISMFDLKGVGLCEALRYLHMMFDY
jgi:hypothetical protein